MLRSFPSIHGLEEMVEVPSGLSQEPQVRLVSSKYSRTMLRPAHWVRSAQTSDRSPPPNDLTQERALVTVGTATNELVTSLLSVPAHTAPVASAYSPSCSSEQPASQSQSSQQGEGRAICHGPGSLLSPFRYCICATSCWATSSAEQVVQAQVSRGYMVGQFQAQDCANIITSGIAVIPKKTPGKWSQRGDAQPSKRQCK